MTNINFAKSFPQALHVDIVQLITSFAYNRDLNAVQDRINTALRTKSLPVPTAWLVFYDGEKIDWDMIFKFYVTWAIKMRSVADTVELFNWSVMKHSRALTTLIMRTYTKGQVIHALRNWNRFTCSGFLYEITNLIWLALTGNYTLTKSAYMNNSINKLQALTYIDGYRLKRFYKTNHRLPVNIIPLPVLLGPPNIIRMLAIL